MSTRVVLLYVCAVSRYTREAGVRTLERKIGAINRAVAVKVAENMTRKRKQDDLAADNSMKTGDDKSSAMALPPELPIVIDEQALEDILGVSTASTSISIK